MKAVSFELIQLRAYEIWEREGAPHGQDKEHWERAERELLEAAPEIDEKSPHAAPPTASTHIEDVRKVAARVTGATANAAESARAR